jgi:hypothetical protein
MNPIGQFYGLCQEKLLLQFSVLKEEEQQQQLLLLLWNFTTKSSSVWIFCCFWVVTINSFCWLFVDFWKIVRASSVFYCQGAWKTATTSGSSFGVKELWEHKIKITQAACKMAAVTGVPTHVMNSDRRYHHCDQRQSSQIPTSSSSSSTSTHCLLSHGVANQPILTPLVERRRNSLLAKMRLVIPPLQTNKFLQSKSSQKRKPSVQQIHSLKARSISEAAATESVQRIGAPPPYQRVGDCLVYPSKGKPKGLIHFLGGAFIGAAPDVTYSFFIELLAKEGFLIVATPYNVTFDHTVSAQVIQNRFNRCLDILSTSSRFLPAELSPDDVAALPIFSVGHR